MSLHAARPTAPRATEGADGERGMPSGTTSLPAAQPPSGGLWARDRPTVVVVTDRTQLAPGRPLEEVVGAALEGGADGVLVRERDLPAEERTALLAPLSQLCVASGAALLVATPLPTAVALAGIPVDGLHLRRDEPPLAGPDASARSSTTGMLVGRSCHDLLELLRAARDRLDHVTVSPVAPSGSKPGYGPALGSEGLRDLVHALHARDPRPPRVLALGGVDAENAARWVEAGADGVAVMGAVMRSPDPADTVRHLVRAVGSATAHGSPSAGGGR